MLLGYKHSPHTFSKKEKPTLIQPPSPLPLTHIQFWSWFLDRVRNVAIRQIIGSRVYEANALSALVTKTCAIRHALCYIACTVLYSMHYVIWHVLCHMACTMLYDMHCDIWHALWYMACTVLYGMHCAIWHTLLLDMHCAIRHSLCY